MKRGVRRAGWGRQLLRGVITVAAATGACLSYSWVVLPDVRSLRHENPADTAFMQLRASEAVAAGRTVTPRQHWVAYNKISPILKRAVIVTEDAAFWEHDGVDLGELHASLVDWSHGETLRGSSTITQQLAKNLYLSPSRNPYRKVVELMIARRLEAELPKQRIFEIYLNVIEWGDEIWGVDAAAHAYFGRSAADLSPEQAALLAGAIINPRVYSPAHPNARLLRRQQIVLSRLGAVGTSSPSAPPPPSTPVSFPPEPAAGE
jgi:monofunctional biosynthetic peptidoglycan transglycosylase